MIRKVSNLASNPIARSRLPMTLANQLSLLRILVISYSMSLRGWKIGDVRSFVKGAMRKNDIGWILFDTELCICFLSHLALLESFLLVQASNYLVC